MKFNTPELQQFDPEEWSHIGYWKQGLLPAYFWVACYDHDFLHSLGITIPEIGCLTFGGGHYLTKQSVLTTFETIVRTDLAAGDLKRWYDLQKYAQDAYQEVTEFIPTIPEHLDAATWNEVVRLCTKVNLFWELGASYLSMIVDALVAEEGITQFPPIVTALAEQRDELLQFRHNPPTPQQLENHRKKYEWIEFASWTGQPLSIERLQQLLLTVEEPGAEKAPINYEGRKALIIELFTIAGSLRQSSAEMFSKLTFALSSSLRGFAEQSGLTYQQIINLTPVEIAAGLRGEKLQPRATDQWICVYLGKGNTAVFENEEDCQTLLQAVVPQQGNSAGVVRGQTGYPGKIRGTVKIILNTDDFHKMQPGDVLVSTMTTPDFVILMQQASAIVTDIGGLLCHAAIVARELQKPCVVGTKCATQVLKDGDIVEIDAETGIVEKIK